jgi:hypothetical protein
VLFVGAQGTGKHEVDEFAWYFSSDWSWGFALSGDEVNRTECDTAEANSEMRLCWHTLANEIGTGYRCGAKYRLHGSFAFERVIFAADGRGDASDMALGTGRIRSARGGPGAGGRR